MASSDLDPGRHPYAGTVPHDDPSKRADKPSSGPGERERQPVPKSITGNAALDSDKAHAERELEALYPREKAGAKGRG